MLATAEDSRLAPSLPPEPSDQPAETREAIDLRDRTVHYAALTEGWGALEALWAEDGVRYAVWASSSRYFGGEEFRVLADSMDAL